MAKTGKEQSKTKHLEQQNRFFSSVVYSNNGILSAIKKMKTKNKWRQLRYIPEIDDQKKSHTNNKYMLHDCMIAFKWSSGTTETNGRERRVIIMVIQGGRSGGYD